MKKPQIKLKNFGIYTKWNSSNKSLPDLIKYTEKIPAILDVEFGYILHIQKGKGLKIDFIIHHPPFKDAKGNKSPPFKGENYINSNDYYFFLGDKIWEPIENKCGEWKLQSFIEGKLIAEKTLLITKEVNDQFQDLYQ